MKKVKIKPFNAIDNTELPLIIVDSIPVDGDPVEIEKEMYYACETKLFNIINFSPLNRLFRDIYCEFLRLRIKWNGRKYGQHFLYPDT